MSTLTADRIAKPAWFALKPTTRGRGKRKVQVIGFDTERPKKATTTRMLQFNDHGTEDDTLIYRVRDGEDPLKLFIEYLDTYCTRKDTEYIIVGWNLSYEWAQLFGSITAKDQDGNYVTEQDAFILPVIRRDASGNLLSRWYVSALNNKMFTATFTHAGTKRRVRVIDGMKFYVTSLDKALKMLGLGSKVPMSKDRLKNLTEADMDDPYFLEYARYDAYGTRKVGETIVDMFTEYDVPTCVSAPQFAARVFKHHFLTATIPSPSPDLEQLGLDSYHGGKNGYYLPGPRHLTGVWSYDITSAYPEAMRALPNPETAQWFPVTDWVPGRHALYRVTMAYSPCLYQGAQDHAGHKLSTEYVDNLGITSYELDAIMAHGEARIIKITGMEMVGPPGGPLTNFVDVMFEGKRTSTGPRREGFKLFLNSLYGKFFQKVPIGDVGFYVIDDLETASAPRVEHAVGPHDYTAGGLYHPPIASLITGFVRGRIHNLEHKYQAIMTSTDGFFARIPPDPADLGKDLGKLTATKGDVTIWRERLYIFGQKGHAKVCYRGGVLTCEIEDHRKAALHGFRGTVDDLTAIPLQPGEYVYSASQLSTLKLARRAFTTVEGTRIVPDTGSIFDARYVLAIRGDP